MKAFKCTHKFALKFTAVLWGLLCCGAAQSAPSDAQSRVEVVAGNDVIASILVPSRARVHTKAERVTSVTQDGRVVVRMEGQAQVDVRDGDKLLFTLKADQLVVRDAPQSMGSVAPSRAPGARATFILG